MRSAAEGDSVMVRLEDGEDLLEAMKKASWEHGVDSGAVVFGIGQLKDFELGYFNGHEYERRTFSEPYELIALHGTIVLYTEPPMHLHAALSRRDFVLIGGHVFKATVATVGEVMIEKFTRIKMGREVDRKDGLKKLTLQ